MKSEHIYVPQDNGHNRRVNFFPFDGGEFGLCCQIEHHSDGMPFFIYAVVRKESGSYFWETRSKSPERTKELFSELLSTVDKQELEDWYKQTEEELRTNEESAAEARLAPSVNGDERNGAVYVIKSAGRFKIGCSVNPQQRISGMQLPERPQILVIHHTPKYKDAERELHLRFADKRGHGEWFDFRDSDLEEVERAVRAF